MIDGIRLVNLTIDCKDSVRIRDFYAGLLGWEAGEVHIFPVLSSPSGLMLLFHQVEFEYERPVWPEEVGRQQKQMHFDFHVDNLSAAVSQAEILGARKSQVQFGGERYVTMFDPEGHPFCFCLKPVIA